jgi:prevent-host-death family protein
MSKKPSPRPVTITSTTLQRQIGRVIRQTYKDKQRFIVERGGLPVVVILSIPDYEALIERRNSRKEASSD